MYVYYAYSHKASFYSIDELPLLRRKVDVHMVLSPWDEAEATSSRSMTGVDWDEPYLATDGTDARTRVEGTWTYNIGAPSGFKEFEVSGVYGFHLQGVNDCIHNSIYIYIIHTRRSPGEAAASFPG